MVTEVFSTSEARSINQNVDQATEHTLKKNC